MANVSLRDVMAAIRRSTHDEEVATKFRRLVALPFALLMAWFVVAIVAAIIVGILSVIFRSDGPAIIDQYAGRLGPWITALALAAVSVGHRRIRSVADEAGGPTFPRPARSTWSGSARGTGFLYALLGLSSLWIVMAAIDLMVSAVARLFGVELSPDIGLIGLIALAGPLLIWAYLLGRNYQLAQLESATPPALQRAHRLRDHAQALEDAMHEATLMADDLQAIIDAERRLITELLEESTEARRIVDIESDQLNALLAHQERKQRRSTLRERWINIAVAAVSLVAGYVLNLANPAFLKNLLNL
ncbi:hypothetical protein PWY87_33030 [Kribbella solani]|uniref:hypothetical protein n=1 Tax=Kribbella solani TaxID=236067 RepID=UPI0029A97F5F|nr:hypothetical protein [Kribbella solani]MDX3006548.1 hypothetical protein [Kribbella solani]